MRIVLCTNHSYPHIGGSEMVVQNIARSMANDYGHDVFVLSRSLLHHMKDGKISMVKCTHDAKGFPVQLRELKPDHSMVYSDCFTFWPNLIDYAERVPGTKSIALVGMNNMLGHSGTLKKFLDKKDFFRVITHSDSYQDYQTCQSYNVPVTVIHNGVDIQEINSVTDADRAWAKPSTDNLVLCVSNFFPGKGQDELVKVLSRLWNKRQDFTADFVSTTVNFAYAQVLSQRVRQALKAVAFPYRFHQNISRGKTLALFHEADVFAFPSQKEVSPLVCLECMAARLPWVGLPVGNVRQLAGCLLVPYNGKDREGYCRYDEQSYQVFADHLDSILGNEGLKDSLATEGYQKVEQDHNWEKIAEKYHDIFTAC